MKTKTWEEILILRCAKGGKYKNTSVDFLHIHKPGVLLSHQADNENDTARSENVSINDILFDSSSNFFEILFGNGDIVENIDDYDLSRGDGKEGIPGKVFSQIGFYYPYHEGAELVILQDKGKYHKMMCSIAPDKLAYLNSVLDSISK